MFAGSVTSCAQQVLTIAKSASVTSTTPGGTVSYTITATNNGTGPVTGATLTDSLADVIDDATVQPGATADRGTLTVAAPNLTWTGTLGAGQTATIRYSVVVKTPATGNGRLVNGVSSATAGSTCPSSSASPACTTTVTVSGLTIDKAASVTSAVPGGTIWYTVTVTNSGRTAYAGATYTDSLVGVLDDAAYQANAAASIGSISYAAPNVTWTGDLAVGGSATILYSVVVNTPRSGDGRVVNTGQLRDPRQQLRVRQCGPALHVHRDRVRADHRHVGGHLHHDAWRDGHVHDDRHQLGADAASRVRPSPTRSSVSSMTPRTWAARPPPAARSATPRPT